MKSAVDYKTPPPVDKSIVYPILMRAVHAAEHLKRDPLVVLFFDENHGVVVHPGNSSWYLGYHAKDWLPASKGEHWTPLQPGDVVKLLNT